MPRISDLHRDARGGVVTMSDCLDALKESEGMGANSVWSAPGHALQHSHADAAQEGRRIDDAYHWRGPIPLEKQLQGGPNAGKYKAAIKIESDGRVSAKSNTFHSQFTDDNQASMCLKLVLQSKAGIEALKLLLSNPRVSVTVTFGMPGGTKYLERSGHVVAAGIPTGNVIEPADVNSNHNFVLIDRKDLGSVVATLRSKASPLGHLHVQTLYPSGDPRAPGTSRLEVSAKTPADYSGPPSLDFT